ncbi:CinA family protein [Oxalobacteraceae bacterium A2-2]
MSSTEQLRQLAAETGRVLQEKQLVLATAESCTGGGVASAVTDIAGSSAWFDCALVTYSNRAKTALLGVPEDVLAAHGAVSEETAAAMARGVLGRSNADVALATTGIAGPGGAVPGKPVGTVCFAWIDSDAVHTETAHFEGDRDAVREQSVAHALQGLLRFID